MNTSRRTTLFGVSLMTLFCLTILFVVASGPGVAQARTEATPKKIITFVYAPRGFNDATRAWWNGFERAGRTLGSGWTVTSKGTSALDVDPASYLRFIQTALVEEPDGIMVTPAVGGPMRQALKAIIASGTKVVIMDSTVPGLKEQSAFVGTDNFVAGKIAAKWLIGQHKAGKLRSNEIAILEAPPGPSATNLRAAGFKAAIKGSRLKIVADLTPGLDSEKGRIAMADVLTAHPNVAGVYSVTDIIAIGAASTLVSQKKTYIKHISVDGTSTGVNLMIKNKGISAEIAQNLEKMGYLSVITLANALKGRKVPKNVNTGITLITPANAKAYLIKAKREARP